jgi:hypothetical protein
MMVNGEELMVNEERAMNVIIVASSPLGRTYDEGTYDSEAAPKAPSCWSPDNTKPYAAEEILTSINMYVMPTKH